MRLTADSPTTGNLSAGMNVNAIERAAAVRHAQRAAGQAAAVATMVTDRRQFAEIAQQLLAARGSLDSLLVRLVELELHDCVPNLAARSEVDRLMRSALGHTAYARHATGASRRPRASLTLEGRTSA